MRIRSVARLATSTAFVIAWLACAACSSDSSSLNGGGGGSGGTSSGDPVLDDARAYNLSRINALRAQHGAAALHLDDALNAFAQQGSVELSQDHRPHANFSSNFGSCGCRVQAENQGDPNGWTQGPIHQQIDEILDLMMSEGPGGGHYDNIVNPKSTRLGVGIVNPGAKLYFTNDFGP
jgi:uncharacterized protein YkwD